MESHKERSYPCRAQTKLFLVRLCLACEASCVISKTRLFSSFLVKVILDAVCPVFKVEPHVLDQNLAMVRGDGPVYTSRARRRQALPSPISEPGADFRRGWRSCRCRCNYERSFFSLSTQFHSRSSGNRSLRIATYRRHPDHRFRTCSTLLQPSKPRHAWLQEAPCAVLSLRCNIL